jgi:putative ATP-binding cassette transporter
VTQVWLNQTTKLTLRRSLVHNMVDQWLQPQRAFHLANAGSIGANPDQRMSADAQHLADLVTDLLIGLLQSTLLLLSFVGVLWFLSQGMFLPLGGRHIQVPGYLVVRSDLLTHRAPPASRFVREPETVARAAPECGAEPPPANSPTAAL